MKITNIKPVQTYDGCLQDVTRKFFNRESSLNIVSRKQFLVKYSNSD